MSFTPQNAQGAFEAWQPSDNGLLGATDVLNLLNNSAVMVAGTLYLRKYIFRGQQTITNIAQQIQSAGVGASSGSFAGVYSSSGLLLSESADIATQLQTLGPVSIPLTTPVTGLAGAFVWFAILANLLTTQPTLRAANPNVNMTNTGLAAATLAGAVNGTGLAALPGSITPGSNTAAGAFPIWFGFN